MIGRPQRKRVVFIDGIPIDSTILNAGDSGVVRNEVVDPTALTQLDPRILFDKYDADGSGGIDLEEFKVLLNDLQIKLSEPKTLAYFKRCDKMRRGFISFEEFRLALYTCDPKNPNRTLGFAPGQAMSPKDLFEMFDKDEEGAIDRATFIEVLGFLGHKMPLDKMEGIFAAHEDPELEMMPYYQFKKVWLALVDVRAELRNRHEKFNRFLPNSTLLKKLEVLIHEEEQQEAKTLLEAANSLEEERIAAYRRWLVEEARRLAKLVLAEALDAAGQVYVLGKGTFGRLDGEPLEPDFIEFMDYEGIKELWHDRVRPEVPDEAPEGDSLEEPCRSGDFVPASAKATTVKAKITLTASKKAFQGRQISLVTAFLWGKRIQSVAVGLAIAYALTDAGQVFCWGGNTRKWRYFYDHATQQDPPADDATAPRARPMTTRTEMLKQTMPSQVDEDQRAHETLYVRQKFKKTFVKPERVIPTDEDKHKSLTLVGQYYDLLPANGTAKPLKYQALFDTIEPNLNVDDLVLSLEVRGVYMAKHTRMELLQKLGDCLALEIECLGDKFHKHMKEQDKLARRARHDRQERKRQHIILKTTVLWHEVRLLLDNIVQAEANAFTKTQQEYLAMKRKIMYAKQKMKRQALEGIAEADKRGRLLDLNGITGRGAPQRFHRGDQALQDIAVGSRHVLAIHQTGKLYTWGVGSFGRLGGVRTEHKSEPSPANDDDIDAWHKDIHTPQVVVALEELRFREAGCGFGHSLALSTRGELYVWGSATHGKLGVGPMPSSSNQVEAFTLRPLRLQLSDPSLRIRKIACGPSHSALLTQDGALFVWGGGDGGKLGLGDDRDVGQDLVPRNGTYLKVVDVPTHVTVPCLVQEKLVEVSCGAAHTVVVGQSGRVFAAGSNHALGKFTPVFSPLEMPTGVLIARVSCGNAHTALVSQDGELWTWGNNREGCTGHPTAIPIVKTPTLVSCFYRAPRNLCLDEGVQVMQSTQNASCGPSYALMEQVPASDTFVAQTQQEICPFWQVSLTCLSRIERVRVQLVTTSATARPGSSSVSTRTSTRGSTRSQESIKLVILISEAPFDPTERGKYSLALAKSYSVHTAFNVHVGPSFDWEVPMDTYGQHVRVQLEHVTGMTMLTLRNVRVLGSYADEYRGARVSSVSCTEGATIAICRPLSSQEQLRERFERAIRADRGALWLLEQLETFHPFVLEDRRRREEPWTSSSCVLCRPKEKCIICLLDDTAFASEKEKEAAKKREQQRREEEARRLKQKQQLEAQQKYDRNHPNKRRETKVLATTSFGETHRSNQSKADKDDTGTGEMIVAVMRRLKTLEEKCHKLLTMNMRTEEEETEAQERLAAELFRLDPMAELEQQRQQQQTAASPTHKALKSAILRGLIALFRAKTTIKTDSNATQVVGESPDPSL
ncbi:hypothetical protein Poli38472_008140 [Pythium oligandrum]|uniref:EF-hand domain-containing protein n=1 Tax=Pythium oligandrum TaxID=41045 RepID=A0A8K1CNG9_PYTOL|nr:hypothetical protein Poli38472_008140 [Pythium oligandrum]|eukprot:TMW65498.1 hypothetical protein Poli38472_008140 [Pythium oligandrum]